MSHCQLLHPNKVNKLKEKAISQLEKRLKQINKLNSKMSKCNNNNNNNNHSDSGNNNKADRKSNSDMKNKYKHGNTKQSSSHGTLNSLSRRTLSAIEMKVDSMLSRSSRSASFSPVSSSVSSVATDSSSVTSRFYDRLFHRSSVKSQDSSSSSSSLSKKSMKHWYSRKHVQDECYSDDEKVVGQRYQQRHQQEQEGEEEEGAEGSEQFTLPPRYHQSMVSLSSYASSSDRKAMVNDTIDCERVNNDEKRTLVKSINDKCNIKCTSVLASSDTVKKVVDDSRKVNQVNCSSYNRMASFSSLTCLTSKCCNDILFAPRGIRVKMKSIAEPGAEAAAGAASKSTATNILDTNNALSSNVSIAPNSTLRFKASPWLHVFEQ